MTARAPPWTCKPSRITSGRSHATSALRARSQGSPSWPHSAVGMVATEWEDGSVAALRGRLSYASRRYVPCFQGISGGGFEGQERERQRRAWRRDCVVCGMWATSTGRETARAAAKRLSSAQIEFKGYRGADSSNPHGALVKRAGFNHRRKAYVELL